MQQLDLNDMSDFSMPDIEGDAAAQAAFQQIEQAVKIHAPDSEQVLMTVCLNLTLFFKDDFTPEKRQAILSLFADYQQMMAGRIHFTQNPKTARWKDLRKKPFPPPSTWLLDHPSRAWQFVYHGGNLNSDASDIVFDVLAAGENKQNIHQLLSYVSINFPLGFFIDRPDRFEDIVLKWCERLQPEHGYGGLATTINHVFDDRYAAHRFTLAQQYPGLDVASPMDHVRYCEHKKIKGIQWFTILNQAHLKSIGGVAALESLEHASFWLQDYNCIIKADAMPALQTIPDSYYQLGKKCTFIRCQDHGMLDHDPELFGTRNYQKWLARFDRQPKAQG